MMAPLPTTATKPKMTMLTAPRAKTIANAHGGDGDDIGCYDGIVQAQNGGTTVALVTMSEARLENHRR